MLVSGASVWPRRGARRTQAFRISRNARSARVSAVRRELCPYANGYYDRIKDALSALLDDTGSFDRAALAGAAKRFSVCPFELGLDLSEWCDVVIGDYNYLFDPVVHLKRFFDAQGCRHPGE